jgi:hypothetical protein
VEDVRCGIITNTLRGKDFQVHDGWLLTMIGLSPLGRFDGSSEIFGTSKFFPDIQSFGDKSLLKPLVSGKISLWKSRYVLRGT